MDIFTVFDVSQLIPTLSQDAARSGFGKNSPHMLESYMDITMQWYASVKGDHVDAVHHSQMYYAGECLLLTLVTPHCRISTHIFYCKNEVDTKVDKVSAPQFS